MSICWYYSYLIEIKITYIQHNICPYLHVSRQYLHYEQNVLFLTRTYLSNFLNDSALFHLLHIIHTPLTKHKRTQICAFKNKENKRTSLQQLLIFSRQNMHGEVLLPLTHPAGTSAKLEDCIS